MLQRYSRSKMRETSVIACVLFYASILGTAEAVSVPPTPCPRLFNYFVDSNTKDVFGSIKLSNDFSGNYTLQINMSLAAVTDKNIRIHRKSQWNDIEKGSPIEYYIFFPSQEIFPRMTSAVFNGKVYCKGPPEEETKDHGVTPLSATDISTGKLSVGLSPNLLLPVVYNNINDPECGVKKNYQALIFSGGPTKLGEYPWIVAIFKVEGIGNYAFICGGNLVSNKHVLTAAHCLKTDTGKSIAKEDFVLVLGTQNITNWATNSIVRSIQEYHIHPEYKNPPDADIAVLLMNDRVIFGPTVRPVCVWDENDSLHLVEDLNGTVVGWGKDENGENYVQVPKQIVLPVVAQDTCLRSDIAFVKFTSSRTFCAGYIGEKRGPCSGDSGSGFYIYRGGFWKIRGIVSLALVDPNTYMCDVNKYVVFTDVTKFIPWMQTVMGNTPTR